jgi:UDP:flavonoid glycosyltransferase YjiC (YdhE family)
VAARLLGLPYVSLQGSHNRHAGQIPEIMRLPELRVSERCRSAVDRLREDFGIDDASPFLYRVTSPYLNLYGEPPQWLPPHSRAPFEPVRFFGSLASRSVRQKPARPRASRDESPQTRLGIYAAFGAASGWTRRPEVLPALHAIIDAVESRADTELLIGLGGHPNEGLRRRASSNVRVQSNADQWSALAQSDLFITHNGMKSTHEGCFHQVPMISYPVQSDQPGLARRCQELDVAVPLSREYRGPVDAHDVLNAINRVLGRLSVMRTALAQARQWEEEVVDGRSEIVAEIAELAASGRPTG